jgi:NAD(P)-dependent dehydrogenase (short-subunit alcohol dehydrogenase family)
MNIIVTGASQGIGFELVKLLSSNRAHKIMAIARNAEALKKLQLLCREQHGNEISVLAQDLSVPGDQEAVAKAVIQQMPSVDILVNNAGLLIHKPVIELDGTDFDNIFNMNVKSAFLLIQALLPLFSKPAHIVNIGSMGGVQGSMKFPGLSLYSASKGALAVLTECLALELKDRGISVNCLALGSAQTEMLQKAFPGYKAPLSAAEMAGFIADFALSGHVYFNGKILPVALSTP